MRTTQYYPVILTDRVRETAEFYQEHFKFAPMFESDWYFHLQSSEDSKVNLAVLEADHGTIPEIGRSKVSGLILNFEVEDVDRIYERLSGGGVEIVQPLRDEEFGQRHFIARDPNGVLIDVITPIPFSPEFLKTFPQEGAPGN